jgi:Glyoxalase-like domain
VPIATYKDLCIDAVDPVRMGGFWAETLGLTPTRLDDGDVRLDGPTPQHAIWVNRVPEPVTVKQRVHLDVHAGSTDEVLARGATRLDWGPLPWDVLADPEGGELCVFTREQVPAYKLYEVVVDSRDGHAIGSWWAGVLGATLEDHVDGSGAAYSSFADAPGMPFEMVFGEVPEPKTVKNRVHWDVDTDDLQPLLDLGASVLRARDDTIGWTVMADPEGNEFCAFTPRD